MMKGTAPAMDVEGAVEGSRRLSVGSNVRKQQLQLMKRPADQLFVEYDFDQNGALDEDEFCKLMTALGMRSQCEKLFVTADIDKSGTLELNEFVQMHKLRLALTDEPTAPIEGSDGSQPTVQQADAAPAEDTATVLQVPGAPNEAIPPQPTPPQPTTPAAASEDSTSRPPLPRPVKPDPNEGREIGIARKLLYRCFAQHKANPRVVIHARIENVPEEGFRRAVEALRLQQRILPDATQPEWADETIIYHKSGVLETVDREWSGTRDEVSLVGEALTHTHRKNKTDRHTHTHSANFLVFFLHLTVHALGLSQASWDSLRARACTNLLCAFRRRDPA